MFLLRNSYLQSISVRKIAFEYKTFASKALNSFSFFNFSFFSLPPSAVSISYLVLDRKLITFLLHRKMSSWKWKIIFHYFTSFIHQQWNIWLSLAASAKKCIHGLTQVETDFVLFRSTKLKTFKDLSECFPAKGLIRIFHMFSILPRHIFPYFYDFPQKDDEEKKVVASDFKDQLFLHISRLYKH